MWTFQVAVGDGEAITQEELDVICGSVPMDLAGKIRSLTSAGPQRVYRCGECGFANVAGPGRRAHVVTHVGSEAGAEMADADVVARFDEVAPG